MLNVNFKSRVLQTAGVIVAILFTSAVQALPTRVDLRSQQTALRNQGDRNTCQTFGATAALEAAYKRAGFGDLNLSEQFLNHVGKMF